MENRTRLMTSTTALSACVLAGALFAPAATAVPTSAPPVPEASAEATESPAPAEPAPSETVTYSPSVTDAEGTVGDSVTIAGSGFAPGETVTFASQGFDIPAATADSDGSVSVTVRVPGTTSASTISVTARGEVSQTPARFSVALSLPDGYNPVMTVSDRNPKAGDPITVSGTGYVPGDAVSVTTIWGVDEAVKVGEDGSFSVRFFVPPNQPNLPYEVRVRDSHGANDAEWISVRLNERTPVIDARSEVPSGGSIPVTVTGLTPKGDATVAFDGSERTVTADERGEASLTLTAPNVSSDRTMAIHVRDEASGDTAEASVRVTAPPPEPSPDPSPTPDPGDDTPSVPPEGNNPSAPPGGGDGGGHPQPPGDTGGNDGAAPPAPAPDPEGDAPSGDDAGDADDQSDTGSERDRELDRPTDVPTQDGDGRDVVPQAPDEINTGGDDAPVPTGSPESQVNTDAGDDPVPVPDMPTTDNGDVSVGQQTDSAFDVSSEGSREDERNALSLAANKVATIGIGLFALLAAALAGFFIIVGKKRRRQDDEDGAEKQARH